MNRLDIAPGVPRIKCPECQTPTNVEPGWVPERGYDPRLRKFVCPNCNWVFFTNISITALGNLTWYLREIQIQEAMKRDREQ